MSKSTKEATKTIRRPYEPVYDPGMSFDGEISLTNQSHKDECDINQILQRYTETGVLPGLIRENPQYGDFSNVQDYQASLNTVLFAQEQFAALPAVVRDRFSNDPAKFLEFAENPANMEEMVKMGLAIPQNDSDGQGETVEVKPTAKAKAKDSASEITT